MVGDLIILVVVVVVVVVELFYHITHLLIRKKLLKYHKELLVRRHIKNKVMQGLIHIFQV